jgi:hypothetical protein
MLGCFFSLIVGLFYSNLKPNKQWQLSNSSSSMPLHMTLCTVKIKTSLVAYLRRVSWGINTSIALTDDNSLQQNKTIGRESLFTEGLTVVTVEAPLQPGACVLAFTSRAAGASTVAIVVVRGTRIWCDVIRRKLSAILRRWHEDESEYNETVK